jgi:hypothetical protein
MWKKVQSEREPGSKRSAGRLSTDALSRFTDGSGKR